MKKALILAITLILLLSAPSALATKQNLDPFNNDMRLISDINPIIGDFYRQVPALCKNDFFRTTQFDDFNRFCRKIEFDRISYTSLHKTCDVNFYSDFKKACDKQSIKSDSNFQNMTVMCESEIFDELDDFCSGEDFNLDYHKQIKELNKGGQVFDKRGNLIGHDRYIPYLSKNITDKRFVPTETYKGYKDRVPGLSYERENAYDFYNPTSRSNSRGYLNYGVYKTNPEYEGKAYKNYQDAWKEEYKNYPYYPASNARYFNEEYVLPYSGGNTGCITCSRYGI